MATVLTNRDGTRAAAPRRPILAEGALRFVGEPMAVIVAETAAQARDAAELIELDYDDLPAKLDLMPGGEALHDEAPDNLAFDWSMGDEAACDAAFAAAAHVVRAGGRGQPHHRQRDGAARLLCRMDGRAAASGGERAGRLGASSGDLCANRWVWRRSTIRVTNPDVGGGFGMKSHELSRESFAVAHAARVLGRPVRWMSERTEAMLSDNAGRDLVVTRRWPLMPITRSLAYRVETRCNLGAYNSQFGQTDPDAICFPRC